MTVFISSESQICYEMLWKEVRQAGTETVHPGWMTKNWSFLFLSGCLGNYHHTKVHMHVLTHSYTIFMCALENLIKFKCSFLLITLSAAILHTRTHPSPHTHALILAALYHQNCKTFQHRQTSLHFFRTSHFFFFQWTLEVNLPVFRVCL